MTWLLKVITSPWRWWQQRQATIQAAKQAEQMRREAELAEAKRLSDLLNDAYQRMTAEYERAKRIHDAVDEALRYRGRP